MPASNYMCDTIQDNCDHTREGTTASMVSRAFLYPSCVHQDISGIQLSPAFFGGYISVDNLVVVQKHQLGSLHQ